MLFFSLPFVASAKFGDPLFSGGLLGNLTPVIKDDFVRYDLGKNYTIDSLYLNQDERYDYVRLLDKDKKLIKRFMTSSGFDSVGVKEVYHIGVTEFVNPIENVRYVEYIGKPPIKLQMDVKGTEQPGVPPDTPINLTVAAGDSSLVLNWRGSPGVKYRVYLDGEMIAETDRTTYSITDLSNDKSYGVQVSAVNTIGESERTTSVTGVPIAGKVPAVKFKYSLADMALAIASWFASIWPVVAFSVVIPLSFIVSSRIKQLFT